MPDEKRKAVHNFIRDFWGESEHARRVHGGVAMASDDSVEEIHESLMSLKKDFQTSPMPAEICKALAKEIADANQKK